MPLATGLVRSLVAVVAACTPAPLDAREGGPLDLAALEARARDPEPGVHVGAFQELGSHGADGFAALSRLIERGPLAQRFGALVEFERAGPWAAPALPLVEAMLGPPRSWDEADLPAAIARMRFHVEWGGNAFGAGIPRNIPDPGLRPMPPAKIEDQRWYVSGHRGLVVAVVGRLASFDARTDVVRIVTVPARRKAVLAGYDDVLVGIAARARDATAADVETWLGLARHDDAAVRRVAVAALGECSAAGEPKVVEELVARLGDRESAVTTSAIEALVKARVSREIAEKEIAPLRKKPGIVGWHATRAVAILGDASAENRGALRALARQGDARARGLAVTGIAALEIPAEADIDALEPLIDDRDAGVRLALAHCVERLGPLAARMQPKLLIRVNIETDVEVKAALLRALPALHRR